MKIKVFAPTNLAFIKYWGKKDAKLRIPANSNLSVCLDRLGTITEIEFDKKFSEDSVEIDGKISEGRERDRVVKHLDRIRNLAKVELKAKVVSKNNFPKSAGLSSSASGFAALSLSGSKAIGLNLPEKDLSRLARIGSGSACRSISSGWVEWVKGDDDKNSYAYSIFDEKYWDLRVLVVILSLKRKRVETTDGHKVARTSLFFKTRLENVEKRLEKMKRSIEKKNFSELGELMELEALSMHAVMLTSKPNLVYWLPETVRVIQAVQDWRKERLESYFTINTGQNVFVVCKPKDEDELMEKLEKIKGVIEVKKDRIGKGARII